MEHEARKAAKQLAHLFIALLEGSSPVVMFDPDESEVKSVFQCSQCSFSCEYGDLREMIALVDEHYERAHTVRDESREYLPLTPNDRRFLEELKILVD